MIKDKVLHNQVQNIMLLGIDCGVYIKLGQLLNSLDQYDEQIGIKLKESIRVLSVVIDGLQRSKLE